MYYSTRMKIVALSLIAAGMLFPQNAKAQEQMTPARDLLRRAQTAVSGETRINDVQVSGTVRRIAGSTDETGRAELKSLATGETQADLTFPSGPMHVVRAQGPAGPVGERSGFDGKVSGIPFGDLLVDGAWFSPALVLARAGAGRDGEAVQISSREGAGTRRLHLRFSRQPLTGKAAARLPEAILKLLQEASQFDLYLDSTTLLPVEMAFESHADGNLREGIAIRVLYSDYRAVDGVQVPFRLEKLVNNSLAFDFQLQTTNFNIGLTAASFVVSQEPLRRLPQ